MSQTDSRVGESDLFHGRFTYVIQSVRLSKVFQELHAGFPKFSVSEIHLFVYMIAFYILLFFNAMCIFQFNDATLKECFSYACFSCVKSRVVSIA